MSTHLDTSLKPPGRGDGSDPTAEAQHSADIADMMAVRAEAHAGRAADQATEAKRYAELAQARAATAHTSAEGAVRGGFTVVAVAMLALGALLGVALSVLTYLAVVRIVHDTVGPAEQRVINDIRTPPADMPTDKDAGPGGIDVITPGRSAPTSGR